MAVLEWEMAKEWIRSTNIVPMNGKAFEQSIDLFDFAHSLRDGVILCQVANQLKPGSVRDVSTVSNIQMHAFLCLRNIRAFLSACSNAFKLDPKNLFSPNDLYDVSNFQAVIHTLSLLSHTHEAKVVAKLKPFSPIEVKAKNHVGGAEDIYGNLQDILDKKASDYYTFGEEESIYDHVEKVDEKIYDSIIHRKSSINVVVDDKPMDKRAHIVNEIIETEEGYLKALKVMVDVYIKSLKPHMSPKDKDIVFMNTEQLFAVHLNFNRDLTIRKSGMVKINYQVFTSYKERFLIYANYCTDLPIAQQQIIELCKSSVFREKVEACNRTAERKFPLQEQLVVPFQRILKYPLLLRDLKKQTPLDHEERMDVEKAFDAVDDIAKFINEYKRDAEMVKLINQIEASVKYDVQVQGAKFNQYGKHIKNGDIQVKFDSNDRTILKRYAFLFERCMLLCKNKGDTYDVKEYFDLKTYKLSDTPPVGRGKFSNGWSLQSLSNDGILEIKNCTIFAKTQPEKLLWVTEISRCIEAVTLSELEGKLDKHSFELTTFETPHVCSKCSKLLRGQISQGYRCTAGCNTVMHKECLPNCPECKPPPSKPITSKPTIHLKPRDEVDSPISPSAQINSPTQKSLKNFPWYAGNMSRDGATALLNNQCDGAFLIRESPNQPGLAISIRYKNDTKHIKIGNVNNKFFLTEPKQFSSVLELINYYKANSLGVSFPTLPTKLTKGVAQKVKRVMIAKFPWQARTEQELSFQPGQRISVITDDGNWWYGESQGKEGYFPNNYVE